MRLTLNLAFSLLVLFATATVVQAEPLDKPVEGPQLICFKYSVFSLLAGERITDVAASAEGVRVSVEAPGEFYDIGESEIFAAPKAPKRALLTHDHTTVYRSSESEPLYLIYGPTSFSNGKDRIVIRLTGNGLRGDDTDAAIYSRFDVRPPARCGFVITYGWLLN